MRGDKGHCEGVVGTPSSSACIGVRWLKSRSSQQSTILPDSIGLVIHKLPQSGALPQFRSAFGCLRVVATPEYLTRTLSSFTSWLCLCRSPVLHLCHLESCLVVPMWVDRAQLPCNPVVLSHKQGVHHGKDLRWKTL